MRSFGCVKEAIIDDGEDVLVVAADVQGKKPVAFAAIPVGGFHQQSFMEENRPGTEECPKLDVQDRKELLFSEGNLLTERDLVAKPDPEHKGPPILKTVAYHFRIQEGRSVMEPIGQYKKF